MKMFFGLFIGLLAALSAGAATYRIDDSGTALDSMTFMHWRQLSPSRKADNTMEGVARVIARLNLTQWVGKTGRIFLVLPEQTMGPIRVSWPANGRFQAGKLIPGHRALVFSGPITSGIMEGTLLLQLEVDGMRLQGVQQLMFGFEIDLD